MLWSRRLDSSEIMLALNNSTENCYWDSSEYSRYPYRCLILVWILSYCETIKTVLYDRVRRSLLLLLPCIVAEAVGRDSTALRSLWNLCAGGCTVVCCQIQIKALQIRSITAYTQLVGGRHLSEEMTLTCRRPQWCRVAGRGSQGWLLEWHRGQGKPVRWAQRWSSMLCYLCCKETEIQLVHCIWEEFEIIF